MSENFNRIEKKFMITKKQYEKIKEKFDEYMIPDEHGKSTICNIYFDTDNFDFIINSISKPYFKEKIRARCYNVPKEDSKVFLEIKKKIDKAGNKRRITMKLSELKKYIKDRNSVSLENVQIKRELDYYFKIFDIKEKIFVSYDREAFYGKTDRDFRITFDSNILARNYDLELNKGIYGENVIDYDKIIMEVKTLGSIPLWLVKILSEEGIKSRPFSKVGEAYKKFMRKEKFEEAI